ncbi:MAG: RNA pseudouridine synthase [Treponema sp.]|nr:RNA pseudouridine synthase [Treponema sp.]
MNSTPLIPIIYENSEIFIINKKAGMPVQGGEKILHSLDTELAKQTGQKVYLVHRLDKETSGLMIAAKNPAAANKWTKLIGSKEVKKEYIAICIGSLEQKQGVINEELVQHGVLKKAVTHYSVEKEWTIDVQGQSPLQMSQLRLQLETGRMHQIRIHLAKKGCPIAGDDQHGNFKLNKILRKAAGIKHLQLFSVSLTLPLNEGKQSFKIEPCL